MVTYIYWILSVLAIAFLIYKIINTLHYWKHRGVVSKSPSSFIKDFIALLLRRVPLYDSIIDDYKEFPNERYIGAHAFGKPALYIRDLEILKNVLVKDFDHFVDHGNVGAINDELISKTIIQLHGQEWRDMRATLSPAFTSSKMKAMFNLITECADNVTKHFLNKNEKEISLDMKELFTKYTNDVIATCAFGVQCDSLKDSKNTFFVMGTDATQFGYLRILKFIFFSLFPNIIKVLGFKIFPKYLIDFFVNTISETITYRTENGIIRPDMIHLLMQARKGKLHHEEHEEQIDKGFSVIEESDIGKQKGRINKELTDMDIAAQAFIFFFAGFETSSTMMSFLAFELALNPEIQEKLLQEINDVMEAADNQPNYESINNMKYLDMVVSEILRKWPPVPSGDRLCVKDYIIKSSKATENNFLVKKGELLFIPILPLHRDEQYFPNPHKFDPERFSDKNKHNIVPFSYLPFGLGPRSCIGNRFALMEVKILFTYLLAKFEFTIVEKTVVPLEMAPGFLFKPKGGFWLGLKARK